MKTPKACRWTRHNPLQLHAPTQSVARRFANDVESCQCYGSSVAGLSIATHSTQRITLLATAASRAAHWVEAAGDSPWTLVS